ncbi:hypothetical protein J1614_003606 [Plenodomus biglobosus]|nr:hypothetical protein J1614_003606 [Plenodomus biglobosus]
MATVTALSDDSSNGSGSDDDSVGIRIRPSTQIHGYSHTQQALTFTVQSSRPNIPRPSRTHVVIIFYYEGGGWRGTFSAQAGVLPVTSTTVAKKVYTCFHNLQYTEPQNAQSTEPNPTERYLFFALLPPSERAFKASYPFIGVSTSTLRYIASTVSGGLCALSHSSSYRSPVSMSASASHRWSESGGTTNQPTKKKGINAFIALRTRGLVGLDWGGGGGKP